jgi:hypothetical protein
VKPIDTRAVGGDAGVFTAPATDQIHRRAQAGPLHVDALTIAGATIGRRVVGDNIGARGVDGGDIGAGRVTRRFSLLGARRIPLGRPRGLMTEEKPADHEQRHPARRQDGCVRVTQLVPLDAPKACALLEGSHRITHSLRTSLSWSVRQRSNVTADLPMNPGAGDGASPQ